MLSSNIEQYLNLRRSNDFPDLELSSSFNLDLEKPFKELSSPSQPVNISLIEPLQPAVIWDEVKSKLEDESSPQYILSLEVAPVLPISVGETNLTGAAILVIGKIESPITSDWGETPVNDWLLDWRLFSLHKTINSYVEIEGSNYELSLLPEITDPMKEFKYFLLLHPSSDSFLPQEPMINLYLDVEVRSSNEEFSMHASTTLPVQREWLVECWNQIQQPENPLISSTPAPSINVTTPEDDISSSWGGSQRGRKGKKRRRGDSSSQRPPISKKKKDLSEEVQKEMDKLFEEAKQQRQRKQTYANLEAEPAPEMISENNRVSYRCTLCKKVYERKDSCRKHISSEVWEYPCSYCGIISATAQACMYHIMAKHLHMQVFDCPHCDKRFATHYALSNHQERSHPSTIQNPKSLTEEFE